MLTWAFVSTSCSDYLDKTPDDATSITLGGSRAKGAIALQSARLQFFHPVSGEKMEFALAMPAGEPWDLFRALSR